MNVGLQNLYLKMEGLYFMEL
ncbi:hypothetical protein Mgra_00006880 [Meloidogyne graminicola]|uniref:Uncharacterized protein n=1 Tax=Meloidogyne graminicola TaxID=189291 RepID=A0A8S9ZK70_9BILA|nr:hypothetical protein Mgra_00006880 [Meloidogyne graminicola]